MHYQDVYWCRKQNVYATKKEIIGFLEWERGPTKSPTRPILQFCRFEPRIEGWNIDEKKALIWVNPDLSSLSFYSSGFDLAKVKKQVTWSRSTESCTELTTQSISFRTTGPLTEMGTLLQKTLKAYF